MDSQSKNLLTEALVEVLPVIAGEIDCFRKIVTKWTKTGNRQWSGSEELTVDRSQLGIEHIEFLRDKSKEFYSRFFEAHSDHKGLVIFPRFGGFNLGHDQSQILRAAIDYLWTQHGSLSVGEKEISAIVNQFEDFVDSTSISFCFRSVLLNFSMEADQLNLPKGLTIRRLSEAEVTEIYNSPFLGTENGQIGIHEFCVEGKTLEPKIFHGDRDANVDDLASLLSGLIVMLRTFKSGNVGHGMITTFPESFFPPFRTSTGGPGYTPPGQYSLSKGELKGISEFALKFSSFSDLSMEIATSRLSDSSNRIHAHDGIMDAVIGMEALLLAAIDDRRELSFRFALNYAIMFPAADRLEAFQKAKDIYGIRSKIALGGTTRSSKIKLEGEVVTESEAWMICNETLRELIKQFINGGEPVYNRSDFWLKQYFGTSCEDSKSKQVPIKATSSND